MSHFYGDLKGSGGEATRCGTKDSGIDTHVRGWDFGVRVRMYHSSDGQDVAYIALSGGSNGHMNDKPLGSFTIADLMYPPVVTQDEDAS